MKIKRIKLTNFRNYSGQEAEFSENLNILFGENAQGKTNVLEAIFLCSTGRSHRTQKDVEMISFGADFARVELVLEHKNYGDIAIEIEIQRAGGKSIRVNGVPQKRMGDLLGRLNCVMFSPEDLSIIKDEPQVRRRFLDIFISQIKPAYFFNLHEYNGILRHRNALIRMSKEDKKHLDTIYAWDISLAAVGAKIMRERGNYIRRVGEFAAKNHSMITNGAELLAASYAPSVKAAGSIDIKTGIGGENTAGVDNMIGEAFLKLLQSSLQSDLNRMSTQYGPHKDDIVFTLDGGNIRLYGSQGQQRTAALSLRMAQIDVMMEETGDFPVLLLDDVMSELDSGRQNSLSANMKNAQTFITGTEAIKLANATKPDEITGTGAIKPVDVTKPDETAKHDDVTEPADINGSGEMAKLTETIGPNQIAKPEESAKQAETVNSADSYYRVHNGVLIKQSQTTIVNICANR